MSLLADYHCRYDLRAGKVKDIRVDRFYPSPFASRQAQGALLERNPLESVVVYRPKSLMRHASSPIARRAVMALLNRSGSPRGSRDGYPSASVFGRNICPHVSLNTTQSSI